MNTKNQKSRFATLSSSILQRATSEAEQDAPPPTSQSAPAKLAAVAFHQRDLEGQLAQAQKEAGVAKLIPINLIDTSPYQKRHLNLKKVQELKANLANNQLSSPVVVREKNGRFELIAGHHRVEAFKLLERSEIPAVLRDFDDVQASDSVFLDNMIVPEAADFEKYLGLVEYKKNHPEASSLRQLATITGFSKSTLSRFFSFEKLPKRAFDFVSENRDAITARLIDELDIASLNEDLLLEAFKLIASGDLKSNSSDVMKFLNLSNQGEKPKKAPSPPEFLVNRGSDFYAKILRKKKQLTINFVDEETAETVEKAIQELLATKANA